MENDVRDTVILIDDNKDILWMWQMFLERLNYRVVILESGYDFREYMDHNAELRGVICILCDENLEQERGSDIYKDLLQRVSHMVPFIIISGLSESEVLGRIDEKQQSYLRVMKKPISLDCLRSMVRRLQLPLSSD